MCLEENDRAAIAISFHYWKQISNWDPEMIVQVPQCSRGVFLVPIEQVIDVLAAD